MEAVNRHEESISAVDLARLRGLCETGMARHIRLAAGLSQAEVANEIDADVSVISRWETGERRPRGTAASRYLRVLDSLLLVGRRRTEVRSDAS